MSERLNVHHQYCLLPMAFTYVLALTLMGYGDLHFQKTDGKYFTIFWLAWSTLIVNREIDIITTTMTLGGMGFYLSLLLLSFCLISLI